jgi:predicted RNase H-like HicB family nuclease
MIVTVIVEQMPHNWCAYTPDLEDSILATAKTREAVIQNFRDAMLDLFDYKREQGEEVPEVTALEIRETREVETLATRVAAAA